MKKYVDLLFESMTAHDQSILPLADRYLATENGIPGALSMFTAWRMTNALTTLGLCVTDVELGSVVAFAHVDMGGFPSVLWVRLRVADERITEIEIYHTQSRAEGGYVIHPEEIGTGWPPAWTRDVPEGGRATRAELLELGQAIFDTTRTGPASTIDCVLMENGGVVHEYIDFLDLMMGTDSGDHDPDATTTMTGVGLDPFRPHDPNARVVAADTRQGVVVAIALVRGYIMPTVTRAANVSAFVPESMAAMHRKSLRQDWMAGRSVIADLPVTGFSTHAWRMFDGKVQGVQMYNSLTAAGAVNVWNELPAHRT